MTVYVLNEDVAAGDLNQLGDALPGMVVMTWPDQTAMLPPDLTAVILIVRPVDTPLERERVLAVLQASGRVVCVYLEDLDEISDLADEVCTVRVMIGSGNLSAAVQGNDDIQEIPSGSATHAKERKRHNCNR